MRSQLYFIVLASFVFASSALADSVAQVSTAKRISRQTVTLIDPQGRPVSQDAGVASSDTTIRVGDILTFIIQFTPVPNGAYRGLGGYITDYIPSNTEVVGARIVDRNGNTVSPHRGGLASDGVGPRGSKNYTTLAGGTVGTNGSLSQLYADTGIFYSTDSRTMRVPTTGFLTLQNGLVMSSEPTGSGGLKNILGAASPIYAHNQWDLTQVVAFGVSGSVNGGQGNTPEHVGHSGIGYGSAVAGPESWYQLEATISPAGAAVTTGNVRFLGNVGPWKRIGTLGSEIGGRGAGTTPPSSMQTMPDPGLPVRVGVPAVDGTGALRGWNLSTDHPLPAATNAVRFALGELVVGDEYYAEISLRVKALPLDPAAGMDANCAEVTGGDASSRSHDGTAGGKDNTWRYFLPAPSCVLLNLLFENTVDKVLTLNNSALTYTIDVKNLSTSIQQNVQVRDCFEPGDETFVGSGTTPGYSLDTSGAGCPNPAVSDAIVWTVGTMAPGDSATFVAKFTAKATATNRAVYTSQALPAPGFTATAFTTVQAVAVMRLDLSAGPTFVPTTPSTVHYIANATNVGTGAANMSGCTGAGCYIEVELPTGFSYMAGTTRINGVTVVPNPSITGQKLRFSGGSLPTSIPPGMTLTIEFDAQIASGTTSGFYRSAMSSWIKSTDDFEDSIASVAPVAVGQERSAVPLILTPISQGVRTVRGTTTEAAGSTVKVFVNGNPAGTQLSMMGGTFSVAVPALFAGQRVVATVTASGELESLPSSPVVVQAIGGNVACSDGIDNDDDTKVDFPADPGCLSLDDVDETDVPQCSDGVDNNGANGVDYPADPGCSSYVDATEEGGPGCSNGVDDDGDGNVDFPQDLGCAAANDVNEEDIPACADGVDNDGDGKVDFSIDFGCSSSLDTVEDDNVAQNEDAGVGLDGAVTAMDGGTTIGQVKPDGLPPDPGGVGDPGGCGCHMARGIAPSPHVFVWCLAGIAWAYRRRRSRVHNSRRASEVH